jgi:hypothetical protein
MNAASSPKLFNTYLPSMSANAKSPAVAALNSIRNSAVNAGKSVGNVVSNATKSVGNMFSNAASTAANSAGAVVEGSQIPWGIIIILAFLATIIGLLVYFYEDIKKLIPNSIKDVFSSKEEKAPEPVVKPPPPMVVQPPITGNEVVSAPPTNVQMPPAIVEKMLPKKKEVFNVSSNKYMYEDAEPLCRALGAELATYDQVKAAFDNGADWCNYGWTKGQLALYPTQKETWDKIQAGPEGQRMSCGRPGLNGGHFDNPELRFGVNCYGVKPAQSQHDASAKSKGYPISPDAMAFDKKVAQFKSEADNIDILPFEDGSWSA